MCCSANQTRRASGPDRQTTPGRARVRRRARRRRGGRLRRRGPVVGQPGFAAAADEVAPLVAAGADFVALGDWVFAEGAAAVAAAAQVLAHTEPVG